MAAQIFAYIAHKDGKLRTIRPSSWSAAARNMFPGASPTASLTGAGAGLDAVCQASGRVLSARSGSSTRPPSPIPTPNCIRPLLLKVLPSRRRAAAAAQHLRHGPRTGALREAGCHLCARRGGVDGLEGTTLKVVRQEFDGQASAHVRCDIVERAR